MAGNVIFKIRRDSSANWTIKNPVLHDGEPGHERDTKRLKIGDGTTAWNDLDYVKTFFEPEDGDEVVGLAEHIDAAEPHPVYDDGPSLQILYENAKV